VTLTAYAKSGGDVWRKPDKDNCQIRNGVINEEGLQQCQRSA
jgi:hypothetical protein